MLQAQEKCGAEDWITKSTAVLKRTASTSDWYSCRKNWTAFEQIELGLYTDLKQGIITQEDYLSLKSGYGQKTVTLTEQITLLKEERQTIDHKESLQNEWIERFRQYGQIDILTRSLVTELIARFDVHEGRTITVHFKFEKVKVFAEQEMQELQAAG